MSGEMMVFFRPMVLSLALVAVACSDPAPPPPPAGAISAGTRIGEGSISGRIVYRGEVPPPEVINMGSDPVCSARGKGSLREEILVGPGGGLANVFVRVSSGLGERLFAPPESPAVLNQDGCTYSPRVLGVQVHQILELINSDPTMHNVHSGPGVNKPFNVGMAVQGQRIRKHFNRPEIMVRFKCDLHNWMTAWVGVVSHPFFAVSDGEGRWRIDGLPAGAYDLEAWHESFGIRAARVVLDEGGVSEVAFDFTP